MDNKELLRIYNSYVPYGLTGKIKSSNEIMFVNYIYFKDYDNDPFKSEFPIQGSGIGGMMASDTDNFKPILFSMNMLNKEVTYKDSKFIPIKKLGWEYCDGELGEYMHFGDSHSGTINVLDYIESYNQLLEWGFNIFNLPETAYIKKEEITTEQFKKGKLL